MSENCYQVLGVSRSASPAEIRAGFVRQVKRHHPDALTLDPLRHAVPPRQLHDIQTAYRILSDPDARARHDSALVAAERHHFARQRAVQRRLRLYDHRHPGPPPRRPRRIRWRALAPVAVSMAITARLALHYLT